MKLILAKSEGAKKSRCHVNVVGYQEYAKAMWSKLLVVGEKGEVEEGTGDSSESLRI